jgi:(E)-4-hydroxy-3-methylbut-2-enyl-diphosphate synthase
VVKTVPEAQIVETLIDEAMRIAAELETAGVPAGPPQVSVS